MTAAIEPWSRTETAIPAPAPPPRRARSARRSPTRSSIALLRLRDHPQLFDAGAVHDVENGHHPPVRHGLVGFEECTLHAPRAQHRTKALIEVRRSRGDAVEI